MTNSNGIRTGRHCVFKMHVHLVFVSKYRRKIFSKESLDTLKKLLRDVCLDFESGLVEFDGEGDHVHLLVEYPPKVAIAKLVNSLKGVSSRRLKQLHPELKNHYYKSALWSPSYFAGSCGGAPIEIVRQYIEQQNTRTNVL
ncbi:IS200/IS605 family transposase [Shewanella psychromarinicola]|uniref:IS200/IS605 family transposase n=1 Tax=Shewanella psychromarinicola TaxID=2487742 RepID=UPI003F4BF857